MSHDITTKDGYMFVLPWEINKPGGVNQVVKSLITEIDLQGDYKSHLLISCWRNKNLAYSFEDHTTVYRKRLRELGENLMSFKLLLLFFAHLPIEIYKLYRLIKRNNIKVINAHFPELNLLTFAFIKFLFKGKFKFILSFHGSDVEAINKQSTFSKYQWRFIIGAADRVIVCSHDLAGKLHNTLHFSCNKIQVIHNGINIKEIYQKLSLGVSVHTNNKPFIISIGTLDKNKGHDEILEAFSKLPQNLQSEISLVLIGRDTPYSIELEKKIESLNLNKSVFVYKNVPHQDTLKTLSLAEFLILASNNEGYPLVLLEAALIKKAIIATKTGGIPELINDGESGYLIDKNDINILKNAIYKLVKNKNNIREKYSNNLFKKVNEQSWSFAYDAYLKSIES